MKAKIISTILILLIIPLVSAANLEVKQLEKNNIIITELENANATFKLQITNNEDKDDMFRTYSLVSVAMYPIEPFAIKSGETIILDVTAAPHKEIQRDKRGVYAFEYQIKGEKTGFFKDTLAVRLFDIKEAVEIGIKDIPLNTTETTLTITNKEDIEIKRLKIIAKSKFFEFSQTLDLEKKESKNIEIPIILDKKIPAGEYEAEIIYELNDKKSSKTIQIQYLEESGISVSESANGFIIKKITFTKTNEGNVPAVARIEARKNILTRLFTIYSDRPTASERSGIFVDYTWEKELGVGESYTKMPLRSEAVGLSEYIVNNLVKI